MIIKFQRFRFGLGIAFGKDLVEELMPYIMEKSSESKIPQINNAIYCIGLSNILDHPILDIYEFLNKGKELGLDEAEDMFANNLLKICKMCQIL